MNSFGPRLNRSWLALCAVTGILSVGAADNKPPGTNDVRNLPPSKRNAPKGQTIQFSAAGAPVLPKPNERAEELRERSGLANEKAMPTVQGSGSVYVRPAAPSKELAEKMLRQMDKKKNWLMAGSQEETIGLESNWETEGFDTENFGSDNKNQSVMERFFSNSEEKNKNRSARERSSNTERKSNGEVERGPQGDRKTEPLSVSDREDEDESEISETLNVNQTREPGGLSDFSLRSALSGGSQRNDGFNRGGTDQARPFQTLPGGLFGSDLNRSVRENEKERESNLKSAAEFQQMIRPRSGTSLGGLDPINTAPDLTRREINPIMPRSEASQPSAFSFGAPPSASGTMRIQSGGVLGVTAPTPPAFSPAVSAPLPSASPMPAPTRSIIMEPPRRIFQ